MSIKKDLERYFEKYNDIPKEYNERFAYILKKLKINEKNMENIIGRIKLQNKIKWKKIQFTLYMIPKATPRPRLGKRGIFYVKNASDLKKYFEEGIKEFYNGNYPINK
ncbi:hypothetical protein, partial [Brevibacillus sp. MCWH]|uniref:hypothetical protein n=1 Tax=Brevibacillus sp. MCWH TaxID=2508871 RepID=UPI0014924F40